MGQLHSELVEGDKEVGHIPQRKTRALVRERMGAWEQKQWGNTTAGAVGAPALWPVTVQLMCSRAPWDQAEAGHPLRLNHLLV